MQGSRAAGRLNLRGVAHVRGESNPALVLGGVISRLAGASIVLACIALPWVLEKLAVLTEETDKVGYIQALPTTSNLLPLAIPAVQTRARPELLDQHYYFVNGCVSAPRDCASPNPSHWGEYYTELHRLYEAVQSTSRTPTQTFDEWAAEHAHFIISQIAPAGARSIERALEENRASGDIHIVGTSAGGAAVFTYLSQAMRGEVPFDSRIRSVLTVDSPLGYHLPLTPYNLVSGIQASAMKTDVERGIGEWAKAAGITILTIDTRQDMVGYDAVPNIANDPNPTYPQSNTPPQPPYVGCSSAPCELEYAPGFLNLGSTWHIYTGSHMANSARQFIDKHWR